MARSCVSSSPPVASFRYLATNGRVFPSAKRARVLSHLAGLKRQLLRECGGDLYKLCIHQDGLNVVRLSDCLTV